jgi:hypothetical protein
VPQEGELWWIAAAADPIVEKQADWRLVFVHLDSPLDSDIGLLPSTLR